MCRSPQIATPTHHLPLQQLNLREMTQSMHTVVYSAMQLQLIDSNALNTTAQTVIFLIHNYGMQGHNYRAKRIIIQ